MSITYYVNHDPDLGNDANDGLSPDEGHALRTIQEAVNRLTKLIIQKKT